MSRSNSGKRRKGPKTDDLEHWGTCDQPGCVKLRYTSRGAARKAAKRLYPHRHHTAYECGDYFHFGTPPQAAMHGIMSRKAVYGAA